MSGTSGAESTRTVAWFHPFGGIAGDMALGALLDAGADLAQVHSFLERMSVDGWELEAVQVRRGALECTHALVKVDHDLTVRTFADILAMVEAADYPERMAARVRSIFGALAQVEGRLHGVAPERVHFHEVGGIDAIVDVVGTCAALEILGVDEVQAGPVALGVGAIHAAHGRFPNPSPAVCRLLEGAPVTGLDIDVELTTPTGAAILAALATRWGAVPSMTVASSGFGAGTREVPGMPNATQVVLGVLRPSTDADDVPLVVDDHLHDHDHDHVPT